MSEPYTNPHVRRHGARVEVNTGLDLRPLLLDPDARQAFIRDKVAEAMRVGAAGINFDHEAPMEPGSEEAAGYTALVAEAAAAFHSAIPGSRVRWVVMLGGGGRCWRCPGACVSHAAGQVGGLVGRGEGSAGALLRCL